MNEALPEDEDRTIVRPSIRAKPPGNALPAGTLLGEFELRSVLGEGGFGIVYVAWDRSLERKVALKEYMPSSLAARSEGGEVSLLSGQHRPTFELGLRSFINEARLLAQFDHPALVKVFRFWEAKGTAYMAMPFYEGKTLKALLRERGAAPDEAWLLGLLDPLTDALGVLHGEQIYHRDIAPDNVLMLSDDRPVLLDFGAARRVIGDQDQALTVILKPSYAPIEQYSEMPDLRQGAWTDVYALAATVHYALTGQTPPPSMGRMANDRYQPLSGRLAGRYSARLLDALDRALAVRPEARIQNMQALREALGLTRGTPAAAFAGAAFAASPPPVANAAPAAGGAEATTALPTTVVPANATPASAGPTMAAPATALAPAASPETGLPASAGTPAHAADADDPATLVLTSAMRTAAAPVASSATTTAPATAAATSAAPGSATPQPDAAAAGSPSEDATMVLPRAQLTTAMPFGAARSPAPSPLAAATTAEHGPAETRWQAASTEMASQAAPTGTAWQAGTAEASATRPLAEPVDADVMPGLARPTPPDAFPPEPAARPGRARLALLLAAVLAIVGVATWLALRAPGEVTPMAGGQTGGAAPPAATGATAGTGEPAGGAAPGAPLPGVAAPAPANDAAATAGITPAPPTAPAQPQEPSGTPDSTPSAKASHELPSIPIPGFPAALHGPAPAATPAPLPATAKTSTAAASRLGLDVIEEFRKVLAGRSAAYGVTADSEKIALKIGKDHLAFGVKSAKDGFVHVLALKPDGSLSLLFPNANSSANRIRAGQVLHLPQSNWPLESSAPAGRETLLVVVSDQPRDYSDLVSGKDAIFQTLPTGEEGAALRQHWTRSTPLLLGGLKDCPDASCESYGAATFAVEIVQ